LASVLYYIIFNKILGTIAHNAFRYTTFGAGDRATRSVDPRAKCAGAVPHKGREPDCGTAEAEPPIGGEAYTVCYATFDFPNYVTKHIDHKLRKAAFFYTVDETGVIRQKSGAICGNKVAAWRTERRIDEIFDVVKWDKRKTLFITLTHPYVKTEQGRKESWEYFQKDLPRYLRKLKTKGMKDFIAVKEAHRDGGCHVHLLCQWERKFLTFTYKGKKRIANKAIRDFIKNNWAGDVDIEAMRDDDIKGYIKKYLGKTSHVENALRRAKREWSYDGDMRHKDADVKKLWSLYYCDKLNIRSFTSSEKKRRTEAAASPPDLVKNMNNSTDREKPRIVTQVIIPYFIKTNPAFEPRNGIVAPNTRAYQLAKNFLFGETYG
jgi:hypothetical protein